MAYVGRPQYRQHRPGAATYLRARRPLAPVNGYLVLVVAPVNGFTQRGLRPVLTLHPTAVLSGTLDVQVEWRTTRPSQAQTSGLWVPDPTQVSEYLTVPSGADLLVQPPNDLTYTTWYYRARAGSVSLNVWSAWTDSALNVNLTPVLGSVAGYLEMNVGLGTLATTGAVAYVDMNIGAALVSHMDGVVYSDLNVGIMPKWRQTAAYSDLNIYPPTGQFKASVYSDVNVDTSQPVPHLWWIRPEQGREGYVFHLFGHGFGAFENAYDGTVYLGGLACQVTRWLMVPDVTTDPSQHIIIHGQGLDPDVITVEHGWITVVVPPGAISAMVKVVLEG